MIYSYFYLKNIIIILDNLKLMDYLMTQLFDNKLLLFKYSFNNIIHIGLNNLILLRLMGNFLMMIFNNILLHLLIQFSFFNP